MKALHFGRFHNDNFGGLERHVALLLRGLSRSMHVDNLVANEGFSNQTLSAGGYQVYKVPSLGVFASMALCPTMPWRARSLHCREHYDIAHLHFPDPMAHFAALALPREVKLVISWHSDIIRQKNALRIYQPFLDRIITRADAIVVATPAHFSASTQLDACVDAKRYVVPYGLDFAPFDDPGAVAAGLALRERYAGHRLIFAVGRHVYYKGFEYLIRAMEVIDKDAILLLGGTGPLSDALKAQAIAAGLTDRVRFLGRISEIDLPAYYHAADIFCMPSVEPSEAFGLVQVEAMICRKPVVCCELNNGVSYVNRQGETGFVVPPRDPAALAAAINQLLRDGDSRVAMGMAARLRAEREFTLRHMWDGMLSMYRGLLNKR
jgi:glycosyltransferase involved in cell wall biosynthesis